MAGVEIELREYMQRLFQGLLSALGRTSALWGAACLLWLGIAEALLAHGNTNATEAVIWRIWAYGGVLGCAASMCWQIRQAHAEQARLKAGLQACCATEQQLHWLLQMNSAGMWYSDVGQKKATVSQSVRTMLRYSGTDFIADFRPLLRVHAHERRQVVAQLRKALRHGGDFSFTARMRCFDGLYRWFDVRGAGQAQATGHSAALFLGCMADISALREGQTDS